MGGKYSEPPLEKLAAYQGFYFRARAATSSLEHSARIRAVQKTDFHYDLPPELIAAEPLPERSDSRLLVVENDQFSDRAVRDLPDLISAKDLLVFNNTKVLNARLFGQKASGGRVEVLLERALNDNEKPEFLAQLKANKKLKPGTVIELGNGASFALLARQADGFYRLQSNCPLAGLLDEVGEVPLPPYIKRAPSKADSERYQTVFASRPGAVAAPTAGLHFDHELLGTLESRGVTFGFTTLHVGAATFQPVRSEDIRAHKMHREYCTVDQQLIDQVRRTRERGGRVIAVGTTTLRALESAAQSGELECFDGETEIFIYPGYKFQVVDALMTNFHLPESTLIMLVAAFIGRERTLAAYAHAVQQRYRFFSYGDAMWITRN